jgi:hypothetical protein
VTTHSNINNHGLLNFIVSGSSFNRFLSLLRRTLLANLLMSLIWLLGLSISPALAVPVVTAAMPEEIDSQVISSPAESDRMIALIACLPKQLSQPSLKRALSEMGNDQLERVLNLKPNHKLSQAEADLASCLNRE